MCPESQRFQRAHLQILQQSVSYLLRKTSHNHSLIKKVHMIDIRFILATMGEW